MIPMHLGLEQPNLLSDSGLLASRILNNPLYHRRYYRRCLGWIRSLCNERLRFEKDCQKNCKATMKGESQITLWDHFF